MSRLSFIIALAICSCARPVPPPRAAACTPSAPVAVQPGDILVVFVSRIYRSRGTSHDQVYVVRGDGSGLRALTDTSTWKTSPSLSPDGRVVTFFESNQPGRLERRVELDVQTGRLLRGEDHREPHPMPGEEIAFRHLASPDRTSTIEIRYPRDEYEPVLPTVRIRGGATLCGPAAGEEMTNLYEHEWSPDSRRFAVVCGTSGASSWYTDLRIFEMPSGRQTHRFEAAEKIRWCGSRYVLAIVGNKRTVAFQEKSRKIHVWANELRLLDLDTGTEIDLIAGTSLTRGGDVYVSKK